MKKLIGLTATVFYTMFMLMGFVGQASAAPVTDHVLAFACNTSHVVATGYGSADACSGVFRNDGAGGMNDSEGFLNSPQFFGASDPNAGDNIWGTGFVGAFNVNTWDLIGKHNSGGTQDFITVTSGNPLATWAVNPALLNQPYVITAKQGG